MGVYPSGQRGQTVNLLQVATVVRTHPLPPTKSSFFGMSFFVIYKSFYKCYNKVKGGDHLENYRYSVANINEKDGWIFINCNNGEQYEDYVPFANFVKTINKDFSMG